MGTYAGSPVYGATIYTFETSDLVEGGVAGIDNVPLKNLADRTAYLKAIADAEIGKIGLFPFTTAPANFLKCNGARLDRATYQALFDLYGNQYGLRTTGPGGNSTIFTSEDRMGNVISHGFTTEDLVNIEAFGDSITVRFAGAGSPITSATDCYVKALTASTFSLHPTASDATNDLNAAEQQVFTATAFATVEYTDSVSVPDYRSQYLRGYDDGLGVYTQPIGGYNTFGTTGSNYTAMGLLACIKYQ